MTTSADLIGGRYALGEVDAQVDEAVRFTGTDGRLGRAVSVWVVDAAEDAPERAELATLARLGASLRDPAFLHVLDVVHDPERLAVVVEGIDGPSLAPPDPEGAIEAAVAAGEAFQDALGARLHPVRLDREQLVEVDGAWRVDPIGIAFGQIDGVASATALVARFLDEHTRGGGEAEREVRALATRWRDAGDDALPEFLDRLRTLRAPAATRARPAAAATPSAPFVETEPTVRLEDAPLATATASAAPAPVSSDARLSEARIRERPATAPAPPRGAREAPPPRRGRAMRRRGGIAWPVVVPLAGGLLAVVLAVGGVLATRAPADDQGSVPPAATSAPGATADAGGPPADPPAAGEVTVGLAAQEDTTVRVTVDGVVQFDGILRSGETQSWRADEHIQVWTDKGKTLLLSVNGHDLGPYSPAMGHPEWNRIDYGFWPGWPG